MKITDYQKVQTLDESNIVLIDGNNGTKTIMVTDFIKSLIGLTSSQDFISGVNLSELTQINTLSADDKLLIGTAAGNKAIGADDALFAILDAFVPKEPAPPDLQRKKSGERYYRRPEGKLQETEPSKDFSLEITGLSAAIHGESWISITGIIAAIRLSPSPIWLSCRINLFTTHR